MPKGKPKRKPQGQSKAASSSQKTVSSSLNVTHDNGNKVGMRIVSRWREKRYDFFVEIAAALLVGLCLLFLGLWISESSEHENTKAQLARAEGDKRQAEDGRNQAIGERDRLQKELSALHNENAGLKKLHPILQFYGPNAKLYASYDLKKEAGSRLAFGDCPRAPCFVIILNGIRKRNNEEHAEFSLTGNWEGVVTDYSPAYTFLLTIKQGCSITIKTNIYDMTFAIEEDRMTSVRAGFGVSLGTHSGPGLSPSGAVGC